MEEGLMARRAQLLGIPVQDVPVSANSVVAARPVTAGALGWGIAKVLGLARQFTRLS
jgi:hypothetical protein